MNTKSAIDALMSALKSNRFDVKFCGITVGKADKYAVTEADDGTVFVLYYGFKGNGGQMSTDIAVDFEEGVVYPFVETEEEYDIDYNLPHDIIEIIKGAV